MARRVRNDKNFNRDIASRVRWLAQHRVPEERASLRAALAAFSERVAPHPGIGEEIERRGTHSYRVFTIGRHLPYLVWYLYDIDDPTGPVSLLMLLHEAQDRERFDADQFD
ncbi:MAG: type II toxin-antitoxin system RelE/ParE family toxin [Gaiellaceae bacterium]